MQEEIFKRSDPARTLAGGKAGSTRPWPESTRCIRKNRGRAEDDFKTGKADEAEVWVRAEEIGLKGLNRFFAIRDPDGKYLGTMEYLLNLGHIEQIAEEKKGAHVFRPSPENHAKTSG